MKKQTLAAFLSILVGAAVLGGCPETTVSMAPPPVEVGKTYNFVIDGAGMNGVKVTEVLSSGWIRLDNGTVMNSTFISRFEPQE